MSTSATSPWFKEWFNSPYYHKLYFNRDQSEAAAFIDKLLVRLQPGKDCRMLDIACGKGRHSRYLAAKGFDVTGIDLAEESIEEAKQFENDHLQFFVHDMRQLFMVNYFDYAFNFFTSFGYFKTQRENDAAIRTISDALKPNGTLVMDYLNVHYSEAHLIHKLEKEIDGTTFYITKWLDETHFYKKIVVEDEQLTEPLEFVEKVSKLTLGDFTDMFSFQGLQIQNIYGDYDFNEYHLNNSPRLIMIAKKIEKPLS
jgi:2-polyprenyl-3-methyl-5-hydroxy-6-metoxy-1,4-benzoquinol methylase